MLTNKRIRKILYWKGSAIDDEEIIKFAQLIEIPVPSQTQSLSNFPLIPEDEMN